MRQAGYCSQEDHGLEIERRYRGLTEEISRPIRSKSHEWVVRIVPSRDRFAGFGVENWGSVNRATCSDRCRGLATHCELESSRGVSAFWLSRNRRLLVGRRHSYSPLRSRLDRVFQVEAPRRLLALQSEPNGERALSGQDPAPSQSSTQDWAMEADIRTTAEVEWQPSETVCPGRGDRIWLAPIDSIPARPVHCHLLRSRSISLIRRTVRRLLPGFLGSESTKRRRDRSFPWRDRTKLSCQFESYSLAGERPRALGRIALRLRGEGLRNLMYFAAACRRRKLNALALVFSQLNLKRLQKDAQATSSTSSSSTSTATERIIKSIEKTRRQPSFIRTMMPSSPWSGPLRTRTRRPTRR